MRILQKGKDFWNCRQSLRSLVEKRKSKMTKEGRRGRRLEHFYKLSWNKPARQRRDISDRKGGDRWVEALKGWH